MVQKELLSAVSVLAASNNFNLWEVNYYGIHFKSRWQWCHYYHNHHAGPLFVAQARQQNEAMQPVASSDPVEIEAMDGQRMTVTFDDVRNFICKEATIAECRIFLETCKQYHLNPFTKEAYLIHYDNKNGDTASTIVLGKTCYMKMAEAHPQYDGFEAGLILQDDVAGDLSS